MSNARRQYVVCIIPTAPFMLPQLVSKDFETKEAVIQYLLDEDLISVSVVDVNRTMLFVVRHDVDLWLKHE